VSDFFEITIFVLVQSYITLLFVRWARRKWSGTPLAAAQVAIGVADAFVVVGWICSYSNIVGHLKIEGRVPLMAGGLVVCYLLTATALLSIRLVFSALRKHWRTDVNPGRRRVLAVAGNTLLAAPFAALGYGVFVQRTDFRVREIDVPLAGLPRDLEGFRLLQLSDVHLSPFLTEREFARVIDAACELRPHLTVMTGDLISNRGDPLDACIRQLARVRSDAGTFACMGNHERYAGAERLAEEGGARAGILFLRERNRLLRFGDAVLNLVGVDHQPMNNRQAYLRGAERMVVPGALNVLLSHNPDVFPMAVDKGYQLMLGGHTHGGQVTIEILDVGLNPARFFTPYVYGLYHRKNAVAYVTRGIGTIGIPARIGAPPEISVLRLRKA
jgi:predicted MPP superfamily phosphohydrolase